MSSRDSVAVDERLRLFCALRLPAGFLDGVVGWQRGVEWPDGVRVVQRPNLHVTLAFLGHRRASELSAIARELRDTAAATVPPCLRVRSYRETRSVGMLVLEDKDGRAAALASDLHARLERLGVYERERRAWLPHLTVVRFRTPARLRPEVPQLGAVSPSDAAVYHSVLRRGGAQYEVLESVPLGG